MRRISSRFTDLSHRSPAKSASGQATVEFAVASVIFLLVVLGTIDFGRAIFVSSELHSAVRDVAREGKVSAANNSGVNFSKLEAHITKYWNPENPNASESSLPDRPGLQNATATVTCEHNPCESGDLLTVTATLPFRAVTQDFLGIKPLTLRATASVVLE